MARYATYRLTQEEKVRANRGIRVPLHVFGGDASDVSFRSLRNVNADAFQDYLFELTVDGKRVVLSAAEMKEATEIV